MLHARVLPLLIWLVYRALQFTWRIHVVEAPEFRNLRASSTPVVFAHWHGDELAILHLLKPYRACAMVSHSKDGAIMAGAIALLGAKTSRGSSTRGGVGALKGILRLTKEGWNPSVAIDGPKGPYHRAKPGVFEISKLIGAPIVPLSVAVSRAYIFEKAWNKTFLPLPFARIQVIFAKPLPALRREADSRDETWATQLESALANAEQQARNLIAST
ncbi:MAG: lysophospholipid acyltransferase family protein [Bdellovibrionaceae bacterium]|nr:lysophospholipid acyltransferase family protein [Pseudobdellovibrionaceae bacterium]